VNCPRPIDPIDLEALASGERPCSAPDAAEHAAACPECGGRLEAFRRIQDWLEPDEREQPTLDLVASVDRLRGLSRRELRQARLWKAPLAVIGALLAASAAFLAAPALTASENLGLLAALGGSLGAEWRALAAWPLDLWRSLPTAVSSLGEIAARDRTAAAAAILLLVPLGFSFARLVARRRAAR
jgi:hypothetical protein